MCFSATASFLASIVLGIIGILTLKKVKSKVEYPLASIPLLFGIQQFAEGVVWVSFNHPVLLFGATYVYTLFSHSFWPVYIPLSIFLVERKLWRRNVLTAFLLLGTAAGTYFLFITILSPITAKITNHSIEYLYPHAYIGFWGTLYLLSVSISCLFSSDKTIKLFGILVGALFLVAFWFYYVTIISVWCFFSAIISMIIYFYLYKKE